MNLTTDSHDTDSLGVTENASGFSTTIRDFLERFSVIFVRFRIEHCVRALLLADRERVVIDVDRCDLAPPRLRYLRCDLTYR